MGFMVLAHHPDQKKPTISELDIAEVKWRITSSALMWITRLALRQFVVPLGYEKNPQVLGDVCLRYRKRKQVLGSILVLKRSRSRIRSQLMFQILTVSRNRWGQRLCRFHELVLAIGEFMNPLNSYFVHHYQASSTTHTCQPLLMTMNHYSDIHSDCQSYHTYQNHYLDIFTCSITAVNHVSSLIPTQLITVTTQSTLWKLLKRQGEHRYLTMRTTNGHTERNFK